MCIFLEPISFLGWHSDSQPSENGTQATAGSRSGKEGPEAVFEWVKTQYPRIHTQIGKASMMLFHTAVPKRLCNGFCHGVSFFSPFYHRFHSFFCFCFHLQS
eukprot:EG_transcript_24917